MHGLISLCSILCSILISLIHHDLICSDCFLYLHLLELGTWMVFHDHPAARNLVINVNIFPVWVKQSV
jgi:hypothetical protein